MLVDQHAEGDTAGVEAVQEVLGVGADERVEAELLLVLNHTLGHGGHHIIVPIPDLDQDVQEAADGDGHTQVKLKVSDFWGSEPSRNARKTPYLKCGVSPKSSGSIRHGGGPLYHGAPA